MQQDVCVDFKDHEKGCQTKARPSINVYIKISKLKAM
jgi:hypothetical protein